MNKLFYAVLAVAMAGLMCSCQAADQTINEPHKYVLQTPAVSSSVKTVDLRPLSEDERLAVLSLQGLVNRDVAEIYTISFSDEWMRDLYKKKGYITEEKIYDDLYELISDYKDDFKGLVVYDPEKYYIIQLAVNIAGVEDRMIVSPDMVDKVKEVSGKTDVLDLREKNFETATSAFKWYYENIYPKQNHNMMACGKCGLTSYDVFIDYVVEFSLPMFWLPYEKEKGYEEELIPSVEVMLADAPVNIPVLGFYYGHEDGELIGCQEMPGVTLCGKYGKMTLVNTDVGNYSYHSGVKVDMQKFEQKAPRAKKYRTYDPNKKYVAMIMVESGDAPCYYIYTGLYPRQWNDPQRGEVPISFGITPSIKMLAPAIAENLYETQTENEYFFCSISGAGYTYPFIGYGEKTAEPDQTVKDYYNMTMDHMRAMDMDMLAIYTHPDIAWTEEDQEVAEKAIFPMEGLHCLLSGMHRTGYTGKDCHQMHGDISIHHTATFWSYDNFVWDDESLDEKSVDHLEKEIKENIGDSQFIQSMFYSWHYGPRRLNLLQKRMEKEGYEFVTMDEFDYLYRQSQEYKEKVK